MQLVKKADERRSKYRFAMERDLRYKITGDGMPSASGAGQTINMCSEGVAFAAEHAMSAGTYVELSINWPVLLDDSCPMRLIIFGRVLRTSGRTTVTSINKYEFRTAARTFQAVAAVRSDGMLQRWADGMRKGVMKANLARV